MVPIAFPFISIYLKKSILYTEFYSAINGNFK